MVKIRRLFILSLLLGMLASAFVVPPMVHAGTITVNTLIDESDGNCTDGDCSLRDALAVANAGDTINFSVTGTIVVTWNLIVVRNVTINGPGANSLTVSGNNASRVLYILYGANATISGLTIANGHGDWGGGIYLYWGTLTVTNCIFSNNNATLHGGGILNWGNVLTVSNSTFSGNSASNEGGGIYNWANSQLTVSNSTFSGNNASYGGGISNWSMLNVINSTFSGNSASNEGGGISNQAGTLNVTNSTFSGNSAGNEGGGLTNWGTLNVTNSTFSGNSASGSGGGGIHNVGTATLKNAIVANSTAGGDCNDPTFFTDSTNNLASDSTCSRWSPGFGQVTPIQLALGTLTGKPAFIPLNPGSVAIDAGTNDGCPATDQRGASRPVDGDNNGSAICDIGAYEFGAVVPNPIPTLIEVQPSVIRAGGMSFALTLNGTHFVSSSVALWNGGALTTTFVSSTQLTATVPADRIVNAGTVSVTVRNPEPGGGTATPSLPFLVFSDCVFLPVVLR